jgi:hypothetical protein
MVAIEALDEHAAQRWIGMHAVTPAAVPQTGLPRPTGVHRHIHIEATFDLRIHRSHLTGIGCLSGGSIGIRIDQIVSESNTTSQE